MAFGPDSVLTVINRTKIRTNQPGWVGIMLCKASCSAVAAFLVLGALVLPATSAEAVTVSRASLRGGLLQVDGANAAPGVFVNVFSSTSHAGARSDPSGVYHVQRANFRAPDCRVEVSDGRTPIATVRLAGCTPTA